MATAQGPTAAPGEQVASAPAPKLTFIPDILEEHLAELAFLWGQRQDALRSPEYSHASFVDLEERIAAHLQGVLVVGEGGLPLIEAGLASEDALEVFASAFSLLHMRDPALDARCLVLFAGAKGVRLEGLRLALCHAPMETTVERLTRLAHGAPGALAVAAAEALAFHGRLTLDRDRLHTFLVSDEGPIRAAGWRLVAYLLAEVEPRTCDAALRDDVAAVRRAALLAGAWCGQPLVLAHARDVARAPKPDDFDALHFLAVLAAPQDVARLEAVAHSGALGPAGMRLLASLGHPSTMGTVLREMENADPAFAAAAGAAFSKMTGVDVTSTTTALVPPADGGDADGFDAEFQEEVALPDVTLAQRAWQALERRLAGAPRIARGFDLGREFTGETFAALDMESRWEACLRGRFYGTWSGSPVWLEAYPQPH